MMALIGCATAYGAAAALVFRRFTRFELLRQNINRIVAHLLELRLFIDEPKTVFQAQRDLFRENLRLLRVIALPCALTGLSFALLYVPLDRWLGAASLPSGATIVITSTQPVVQPPKGTIFDTPQVHVIRDGTFSRRGRVTGPNALGHQPWLTEFVLISMLAGAAASTSLHRIRF